MPNPLKLVPFPRKRDFGSISINRDSQAWSLGPTLVQSDPRKKFQSSLKSIMSLQIHNRLSDYEKKESWIFGKCQISIFSILFGVRKSFGYLGLCTARDLFISVVYDWFFGDLGYSVWPPAWEQNKIRSWRPYHVWDGWGTPNHWNVGFVQSSCIIIIIPVFILRVRQGTPKPAQIEK